MSIYYTQLPSMPAGHLASFTLRFRSSGESPVRFDHLPAEHCVQLSSEERVQFHLTICLENKVDCMLYSISVLDLHSRTYLQGACDSSESPRSPLL